MATCVLEINDTALTVGDGEGIWLESPGYAVLDAKSLLIGNQARQNARLNPRATHNSFWDELSLEPLSIKTKVVQHAADLAFRHLQQIWERIRADASEVILAVPGTFDKQQLGLLLGVARECGMPVSGLVDSAVVAAGRASPRPGLLHLDLQLHRIVLTALSNDEMLARTEVLELSRAGEVRLQELWAGVIAESFVRSTRFDPLHTAETEQALYNQLPEWLTRLAHNPSIVLEMRTANRTHQITLARERLLQATSAQYEQLVQRFRGHLPNTGRPAVLVSHRLAELPGLVDALRSLTGVDVLPLSRHAVVRGALYHKTALGSSGEGLKYVTRVPAATEGYTPPPAESQPAEPAPTHVLHQSRAYALNEHPLHIGRREDGEDPQAIQISGTEKGSALHCSIRQQGTEVVVEDHSEAGTYLNDTRIMSSAQVRIGDILQLGPAGEQLQLIELVANNAPPT